MINENLLSEADKRVTNRSLVHFFTSLFAFTSLLLAVHDLKRGLRLDL